MAMVQTRHLLQNLCTQNAKSEMRPVNTSRQAPSPIISVTACHSGEKISLKVKYESQEAEMLAVSLTQSRNEDTELMVSSSVSRSSQLEK